MSLGAAIDNNLAVLLLGFSMTGGLAYGGYRVFKDNPRPATQLLKMKKKVLLDKEGDDDKWKANWKKYVAKHTSKIQEEAPADPAPKAGAKKAKGPNTKIEEKDIWGIDGWAENSKKLDVVPESFKTTCENKSTEKFLGTWTTEYEDFEKYCTKDGEDE